MTNKSLGSIPQLPTLVWDCILDCALNLTCRGFRRLVLPILFETLHIHFRQKRDTGRQMLQDIREAGDELFCVASSLREDLDRLKPVLLALQCLDRLDMKYITRSQGDAMPLFSLGSGDKMNPLRTLCLTNFTVDSNQVNEWEQCSHIRHLGLDGGAESLRLLALFTGRTPNMTSLALRICGGTSPDISHGLYSRLDEFLQSVKTLVAFTAYDLSKDILPLLVSRHGSHLRRLRFRQTNFDMSRQEQIRCLFTFEELQSLASALPQLERLGIDLRFKGHLSYDILSGAACFPSLKHLELNANFPYGECGINGRTSLVEPWLNAAVAEDAFRYVAGEKLCYERMAGLPAIPWSPFKALDIKVGEWEPFLEDYRMSTSASNPIFMYACRWASCRPAKVDTVQLRFLAQQYPIENDQYEQALARAGLWSRSKLLSGPGAL
ncbi:hypothetical protein FE257_005356 [Aspergillus nanangensis]|uniref:Uncharacterized protein n=1 Tax=Aspergillus nanangensis TaxID=2582783 RepID=A0AAD4GVH5_ASPNN|nr:hypothetical protein FE257_005356 [Aspergillus nanangensis]